MSTTTETPVARASGRIFLDVFVNRYPEKKSGAWLVEVFAGEQQVAKIDMHKPDKGGGWRSFDVTGPAKAGDKLSLRIRVTDTYSHTGGTVILGPVRLRAGVE